jgi:lipopolysaccharide/colanic/teichoic acid biosynthesis glycosyltransferase
MIPYSRKQTLPRLMDAGVALIALVVLAPVLAVLALVVLAAQGRPVLFRQSRIGKGGRPFLILKFCTMHSSGVLGSSITTAEDNRVTRLGVWLRKLKLDELPQFLNVLRGEMSLIGPRPEVPEYVQLDSPLWRAVLQARPGITDLASLAFRDEETMLGPADGADAYYRSSILPAKLRLNILYQQSRTLRRDVTLLWLTARYSFFPHGYDRQRILRALGGS